MCSSSSALFGAINLTPKEVKNKSVIEIGSININGSLRPLIESYKPAEYIGVDIVKRKGVDIVCSAENILDRFGKKKFDFVISTEMLEHVKNWKKIVSNIKNICKPGGIILITTRSYGYPYHSYPNDFWRYELNDMKTIFSDCDIISLESDFLEPGVFIKLRKPKNFIENDISDYALYSVILNKHIKSLEKEKIRFWYFLLMVKEKIKRILIKAYQKLFK